MPILLFSFELCVMIVSWDVLVRHAIALAIFF